MRGVRFRLLGALRRVAALLLSALFLVLSGACGRGLSRYEASYFDVFDTVSVLTAYAPDEATAAMWFEEAHAFLQNYHKLYDIYNEHEGMNNACTLNLNAGVAPVAVDPALFNLLLYAKDMCKKTGGAMNIALGSVLSIWHDYREAGLAQPANARVAPMEALAAAAEHAQIDRVLLDADAGTVFLEDAAMKLDLGSIAKGYATQCLAQEMRARGVTSMLLNVGGNICAVGGSAQGRDWRVGVQSPYGAGALVTVNVKDLCLVTSGSYQRYYTVDGVRYHHLIDPDTLMPAAYFDSVTVLCADSALADALSTALFVMDLSEGKALLASFEGAEAFWVALDGTQTMTDGFRAALSKR